jgi:hypothetical protein
MKTGIRWAAVVTVLSVLALAAAPRPAFAQACGNDFTDVEECDISDDQFSPGIISPNPGGGGRIQGVDPQPPGPAPRPVRVRITTDRRFYYVGEPIRVCIGTPGLPWRVINDTPDGYRRVIWEGTGDTCLTGSIIPPVGRECVALSVYAGGRWQNGPRSCFQTAP